MSEKLKGVICAGGQATRLGELTRAINKAMLPVYKWPIIYYPLMQLELAGIKEVLIITNPEHRQQIKKQLGNGCVFDRQGRQIFSFSRLEFAVQKYPGGIAQAIGLAENFCDSDKFIVILGDNILENNISDEVEIFKKQKSGARILLAQVPDPERFGVPRFNKKGTKILEIIEKPKKPPSSYAVIGVYMYDRDAFKVIKNLKPSKRGELEVTDLNNYYLKRGDLTFGIIQGWWRDVGTSPENLAETSILVMKTGACGLIL